jgi:hypothetical protein
VGDKRVRAALAASIVVLAGCRSPAERGADDGMDAGRAPRAGAAPDASGAAASKVVDAGVPWTEVYYPGWAIGTSPPDELDWAGVSDVVLFGLVPGGPGVEARSTALSDVRAPAAASAARAHGAAVLVAVGGQGTGERFRDALARDDGSAIVRDVAAFVARHRLDGVVLDIEPLAAVPEKSLVHLVRALRASLSVAAAGAAAPRLEAVVAPSEVTRLAPVARELDRIGLMSYLGGGDDDAAIEALARLGVPLAAVGTGNDARTPDAVARARVERARAGALAASSCGRWRRSASVSAATAARAALRPHARGRPGEARSALHGGSAPGSRPAAPRADTRHGRTAAGTSRRRTGSSPARTRAPGSTAESRGRRRSSPSP